MASSRSYGTLNKNGSKTHESYETDINYLNILLNQEEIKEVENDHESDTLSQSSVH